MELTYRVVRIEAGPTDNRTPLFATVLVRPTAPLPDALVEIREIEVRIRLGAPNPATLSQAEEAALARVRSLLRPDAAAALLQGMAGG